jgi:hypothetical protein
MSEMDFGHPSIITKIVGFTTLHMAIGLFSIIGSIMTYRGFARSCD